MTYSSRSFTVPKIASQIGDAPLYETLNDIAARSAVFANEIVGEVNDAKIGGTGVAGYLPYFLTGKSLGASPAFTDGTNIGIGMVPTYPLDVNGAIRGTNLYDTALTNQYIPAAGAGGLLGNSPIYTDGVNAYLSPSAANPYYAVTDANSGTPIVAFLQSARGTGTGLVGTGTNHALGICTNSLPRVTIDTAGNVGIGTTWPNALLELSTVYNPTLRLTETAGGVGANSWEILTGITARDQFAIKQVSSGLYPFFIAPSGNIGIGTTSPQGRVEVHGVEPGLNYAGTITAMDTSAIAAGTGARVVLGGTYLPGTTTGGAGIAAVKENATSGDYAYGLDLLTRGNGASLAGKVRITASGNVGINQPVPEEYLHVSSTGAANSRVYIHAPGLGYAGLKLGSVGQAAEFHLRAGDGGDQFTIYDGNHSATRLAINTNGNVGIGTTSFITGIRLDVNGVARAKVWDNGGAVFSVKAFLANGDGTTDDTMAINNAITAAAAVTPRGVVFFPPGKYRTTGNHDLTGLDGLRILGAGIGSTEFLIDSATNDLFKTTSQTYHLHIGGFRVDKYSTVTRTGGWVCNMGSTGLLRESIIEDIQMFRQNNGIKVKHYEFVEVMRCYMREGTGAAEAATPGIGFQAGSQSGGGELHFYFCEVDGNNAAGGRTGANMAPAYGFVIDDTPGVRLISCHGTQCKTNAFKLIATATVGTRLSGITLTNCISDNTYDGASTLVTGAGYADHIQWANCWFAGAGNYGVATTFENLRFDCDSMTEIQVTGCTFYAAHGHGIAILPTAYHGQVAIGNCAFRDNGSGGNAGYRSGIHYDVPATYFGPCVTGSIEYGHQFSISCPAARTVRAVIVGNAWTTATSLGTAPTVNANNGPV